jgi:hypothetical protein
VVAVAWLSVDVEGRTLDSLTEAVSIPRDGLVFPREARPRSRRRRRELRTRMDRPPRFRIDGRTAPLRGRPAGWPAERADAVIPGAAGALALAPLQEGPLGLESGADTLGGLVAPRRATRAADETAYLLSPGGALLARAPGAPRFAPALPRATGIALEAPNALLAVGGLLLVAEEAAERVLAFRTDPGILVAVLSVPAPRDIAWAAGALLALDAGSGTIWRAGPALDAAVPILATGAADSYERLIALPDGRIALKRAGEARLALFPAGGGRAEETDSAEPLRDLMPPPVVKVRGGALVLDGMRFDDEGRALPEDPLAPPGPRTFPEAGEWLGAPLDAVADDAR